MNTLKHLPPLAEHALSADGSTGWDEPLPLDWRSALPAFPIAALPPVLRTYAEALAVATQTPGDLPGSVVLGIVAACTGGRVRVRARPGWTEPVNLWIVPVLPPGSRKSAVIEACMAPLMEAEDVLRETVVDLRRDRLVEQEARRKYAQNMILAAAKDCDTDKDGLAKAKEAARQAEEIEVPASPQLTVDDSTPEAFVSVLAEQGGRVAAISAEAGVFEALTGRYTKKANLDAALKSHAGDTIRVTRQLREPQLVRRPALTLVSTIQPFALRELVSRPEFAGRGLLARVLWAMPADNVGYRLVGTPPVSDAVAESYRQLVSRLAVHLATQPTITVGLTREAAARHLDYEREIEIMLRPDDAMGAPLMRQWGSKLAGATLRIAANLHAATYDLDSLAEPVDDVTMASAILISEYYRSHASAALHPGDDEATSKARALARWLIAKAADGKPVRARDIQRGGPAHLRAKNDLDPVLRRLTDLGWIRPDQDNGYELHPLAGKYLSACDTCDTCDTDSVSAGQQAYGLSATPSQNGATPATQETDRRKRRSALRQSPNGAKPALTREDVHAVAGVAGVAAHNPFPGEDA